MKYQTLFGKYTFYILKVPPALFQLTESSGSNSAKYWPLSGAVKIWSIKIVLVLITANTLPFQNGEDEQRHTDFKSH